MGVQFSAQDGYLIYLNEGRLIEVIVPIWGIGAIDSILPCHELLPWQVL
jgi:hypothetical protein